LRAAAHRQTDPISRPMTPAPMTIIFSGTAERSSAPVESTIFLPALSTVTFGSDAGIEPVAITTFFAVTVCSSPPSIGCTLTEPGATISPAPLM
jgi:hypothetical protein